MYINKLYFCFIYKKLKVEELGDLFPKKERERIGAFWGICCGIKTRLRICAFSGDMLLLSKTRFFLQQCKKEY